MATMSPPCSPLSTKRQATPDVRPSVWSSSSGPTRASPPAGSPRLGNRSGPSRPSFVRSSAAGLAGRRGCGCSGGAGWGLQNPADYVSLADVWPLRRISVRAVVEKLPLAAISLVMGYVAYRSQDPTTGLAQNCARPDPRRAIVPVGQHLLISAP